MEVEFCLEKTHGFKMKMAPAAGLEPATKWLTVKLIFVEKLAQNIPSQSFFSVLIFDLS